MHSFDPNLRDLVTTKDMLWDGPAPSEWIMYFSERKGKRLEAGSSIEERFGFREEYLRSTVESI
jgi:hypothetical protein